MKFRFLDKIAIADIAFEAFGKNEKEVFENSALALFEIMCDTKKISSKVKKKIRLKAESLEWLLYDFLSELVFLKDTKSLVFGKFDLEVKQKKLFELNAVVFGEKIDYKKNSRVLRNDVKAITKHLFSLKKEKNKFTALVVPDI